MTNSLFLVFTTILINRVNTVKEIHDTENLRWEHPRIHKKLIDREVRFLILSPWHTKVMTNCDFDFEISAFLVFDSNFDHFTKVFLENYEKQKFRKVEFRSFANIARPFLYDLDCNEIKLRKTDWVDRFGELYVYIPEKWYYDANSIFFYNKRVKKLEQKTKNAHNSKWEL